MFRPPNRPPPTTVWSIYSSMPYCELRYRYQRSEEELIDRFGVALDWVNQLRSEYGFTHKEALFAAYLTRLRWTLMAMELTGLPLHEILQDGRVDPPHWFRLRVGPEFQARPDLWPPLW